MESVIMTVLILGIGLFMAACIVCQSKGRDGGGGSSWRGWGE